MRTIALVAVVVAGLACGNKDEAPVAGTRAATAPSALLTEPEYAARLIAELKKHGEKAALHFDAARSMITDGEMQLSTKNIYAEYVKLPPEDRAMAFAHVVETFSQLDKEPEKSLAVVRPKLLPAVRAGMYFDWQLQHTGKDPLPAQHAVYVPLGEMTGAGVAIDEDNSMQIATDKQLAAWGVTIEQALDIATKNLANKGTPFEQVQRGLWTSPAHDNYDASRLLLVDEIEKLRLKGTVVAMIPNRDTIYLAGSEDAKALLAMADLAEKAAEEPRPIHTVPLCLNGTRWADCEPGSTEEVRQRMHAVALAGRQSLYGEQKETLEEKLGGDVFVASYTVFEDTATKHRTSYATWTKTVPTLLPHAEQIMFVEAGSESSEKPQVLGSVPWARVMAVIGAHLTPDGRSPPRWATGDYFPSPAELAKLAPTRIPKKK
jgi:uncharacterized protein YtpQ (UPF0354 family)